MQRESGGEVGLEERVGGILSSFRAVLTGLADVHNLYQVGNAVRLWLGWMPSRRSAKALRLSLCMINARGVWKGCTYTRDRRVSANCLPHVGLSVSGLHVS